MAYLDLVGEAEQEGVSVTVDSTGVTNIAIEPSVVSPERQRQVETAVRAAVNQALDRLDEARVAELRRLGFNF